MGSLSEINLKDLHLQYVVPVYLAQSYGRSAMTYAAANWKPILKGVMAQGAKGAAAGLPAAVRSGPLKTAAGSWLIMEGLDSELEKQGKEELKPILASGQLVGNAVAGAEATHMTEALKAQKAGHEAAKSQAKLLGLKEPPKPKGRPSKLKPLRSIADDVAKAAKAAAKVPSFKGVYETGKHLKGAGKNFLRLGGGIGKGMALWGAGTAAGNAALLALNETGALTALPGVTQEEADKYTQEFVTTEYFGVEAPNLDPITSVVKTSGAIDDLEERNQNLGRHGDDFGDKAEFVRDEVSDEYGEIAGGIAGGVVYLGEGLSAAAPWNW